jgi:hypothetical protein
MTGLAARWVRFYTRDLPAPVAARRVAEIDADLHDHIADERAHGVGMKTRKPLHRSVVRVALGAAIVLSLPLVAMQLTDAVAWSLAGVVVAGVLLATIGVALEPAVRKAGNLPTAIRHRRSRRRRGRRRGG